MRSVVISNDHINFTGRKTAHREAPLNGSRERHREDAGFLCDFTPAWQQQESLIKRSARSVNRGVLDAQLVIVAHLKAEFGQIAQAVGVGDGNAPANRLRRFKSCLLYTSPSPRDRTRSRMPSSA